VHKGRTLFCALRRGGGTRAAASVVPAILVQTAFVDQKICKCAQLNRQRMLKPPGGWV